MKTPVVETAFYFIPAVGEGKTELPAVISPNKDRGDIFGQSDKDGHIALNNIPPGNYYLVVWAPMTWVAAQNASDTDQAPRLYKFQAGQREALGTIYVPWP